MISEKSSRSPSGQLHVSSEKKRVYLVEFNLLMGSGGVTYLPVASGMLKAYAISHSDIAGHFAFQPFIFEMDSAKSLLEKFDMPYIVGFSNSMWNEQLNLALAKALKSKYPDVLIVFGGPSTPDFPDKFLKDNPYIDFTIRAEGEKALAILLRTLMENGELTSVPYLSFRDKEVEDNIISNLNEPPDLAKDLDQYPSPYLTGQYDYLFETSNSGEILPHRFQAIIETNRGCPFLCTYCYWGRGGSARKYRFHSLERIGEEIEWFAKHRIEYLFNADSNFGMHKRDMEIAKMLVDNKKKYGYPEKFRTCWGKNTDKRIFQIANFLHDNELDKGITLARQTNNKEALVNVKRDNISLEAYTSLQEQFNVLDVPVYCEMILGLPGETVESWYSGIEESLSAGLNNSLFVYQAEVYPNTELNEPEYRKKHGIQTHRIELTEIHCSPRKENFQKEFIEIVTSTNSMPEKDWHTMTVFSWVTMIMHSMKLGYFLVAYLHNELGIEHVALMRMISRRQFDPKTCPLLDSEVGRLSQHVDKMLTGDGRGVLVPRFSDVYLDPEEASFLRIIEDLDQFYAEIRILVDTLIKERALQVDDTILGEVFKYQEMRIPRCRELNADEISHSFAWNLPEYFHNLYTSSRQELKRIPVEFIIDSSKCSRDKALMCKNVVIQGRKSGGLLNPADERSDFFRGKEEYEEHIETIFQEDANRRSRPQLFDSLHKFEKYRTSPKK
jgi:radical SAM superfamily enzyme YgiQ (UPF0313 family)